MSGLLTTVKCVHACVCEGPLTAPHGPVRHWWDWLRGRLFLAPAFGEDGKGRESLERDGHWDIAQSCSVVGRSSGSHSLAFTSWSLKLTHSTCRVVFPWPQVTEHWKHTHKYNQLGAKSFEEIQTKQLWEHATTLLSEFTLEATFYRGLTFRKKKVNLDIDNCGVLEQIYMNTDLQQPKWCVWLIRQSSSNLWMTWTSSLISIYSNHWKVKQQKTDSVMFIYSYLFSTNSGLWSQVIAGKCWTSLWDPKILKL